MAPSDPRRTFGSWSLPARLWVGGLLFTALVVPTGTAHAYEALVQTTLSSQSYQIRDAEGSKLGLQRLDTYLRLFVTDLLPEREDHPRGRPPTQMHIVMSLRLRADAGSFTRGWDPRADGHGLDTWVSGPDRPTLEILYAHLSVTDLAGFLDLKLGRLFQMDPLDFYGFDGLHARARLPLHLALELVTGLRNSGHWAIDAPIFLADGTALSDSRPGAVQPMLGVALETHGLPWLRLRLAYRTTWHILGPGDAGSVYPLATQDRVPRVAISEEKLTAYVQGSFLRDRVTLYGGVRHNLVQERLDEAQAGVALRLGRPFQLRAEYVRDQPDFDGDSLFNIFNAAAYQEVRLWYEHRFTARWQAYLRLAVRLFEGGEEEAGPQEGASLEPDLGGGLGVHYLGRRLAGRVDLYWQEGYGGRTLGALGFVRARVVPGWLDLEGRMVVAHWKDDLGVTPRGTTGGLTLGARLTFARQVAVHVLVEDNVGTYTRSDLRLFALLDVSFCTAGYCPAGAVLP